MVSSLILMFVEVIFVPDPCELTFANTILLSNAALSLNVVFISRDALGVFHWSLTISLYFCFLFLFLQLKEFKYLGFYKNDSTNGCCFIFLSGLHFFHVVVGFIIIGITSNSVLNTVMMNLYSYLVISVNLYLTVQILYWHFVEVVWLFIFLILFYYYIYSSRNSLIL